MESRLHGPLRDSRGRLDPSHRTIAQTGGSTGDVCAVTGTVGHTVTTCRERGGEGEGWGEVRRGEGEGRDGEGWREGWGGGRGGGRERGEVGRGEGGEGWEGVGRGE